LVNFGEYAFACAIAVFRLVLPVASETVPIRQIETKPAHVAPAIPVAMVAMPVAASLVQAVGGLERRHRQQSLPRSTPIKKSRLALGVVVAAVCPNSLDLPDSTFQGELLCSTKMATAGISAAAATMERRRRSSR
jgi:hypothetical protein